VLGFVDQPGNDEAMIVRQLDPACLLDRRSHPNFLAKELRLSCISLPERKRCHEESS
jgi:hypothetical protein